MRNFFRKTFTVVITLVVAIAFFPTGFMGQTVSYAQTVNTVSLVGKYDSSDLAIINRESAASTIYIRR